METPSTQPTKRDTQRTSGRPDLGRNTLTVDKPFLVSRGEDKLYVPTLARLGILRHACEIVACC